MSANGAVMAGFFAAGAAMLFIGGSMNRRRRSAARDWARARGWAFSARDDSVLEGLDGRPFRTGHSRSASDVLVGTVGRARVVAFEHHYSVNVPSSFANRQSAVFHRVVVAELPVGGPTFTVTPAGTAGRLAQAVGMRDVSIGHERFDRSFRCHATDPEAFRSVFTGALVELLVARPRSVQSTGERLVLVEPGRLRVADLDDDLAFLDVFLEQLPESS